MTCHNLPPPTPVHLSPPPPTPSSLHHELLGRYHGMCFLESEDFHNSGAQCQASKEATQSHLHIDTLQPQRPGIEEWCQVAIRAEPFSLKFAASTAHHRTLHCTLTCRLLHRTLNCTLNCTTTSRQLQSRAASPIPQNHCGNYVANTSGAPFSPHYITAL